MQVHKGVKGFIIEEYSLAPVFGASIFVSGIAHEVKTASDGDYWRLLSPGTYEITVAKSKLVLFPACHPAGSSSMFSPSISTFYVLSIYFNIFYCP